MSFPVLGMGMVALYGLSMGNNKTYQWVTAMVVNFFWNIFVESLIKVKFCKAQGVFILTRLLLLFSSLH